MRASFSEAAISKLRGGKEIKVQTYLGDTANSVAGCYNKGNITVK